MEELAGQINRAIIASIVLLLVIVITTGLSIFASRVHVLIGAAIEFFSRGFVFVVWLTFVLLAYAPIRKVFEEFGADMTPVQRLLEQCVYSSFILVPVAFILCVINATVLAVIARFNRNAATAWSSFVSIQLLVLCLATVFGVFGQVRYLQHQL